MSIPGYTYGTTAISASPLSTTDLENLKKSVLFEAEDERYLQLAGEVLDDQIEAVLDVWYGFVASHPHLVYYFTDGQGNANSGLFGCGASSLWAVDFRYLPSALR